MHQYLAVTSNGLENLLADELEQLGVENPKAVQAGVRFKASNELMYRVCLWSRLASRYVRVLSEFTCDSDLDIYLAASSVNWESQFHSDKKIVVDFNGTNNAIRNSQYGAMKVKDAIVDQFTKKNLPRPSISKDLPDLRVHVRLHRDKALLGIDVVGGSLHARGYRTQSGAAPLRETLAAALIIRSGWDKKQAFVDPMCGSGTLVIEAAMMAADVAAGLKRSSWSFTSLQDYDHVAWSRIHAEASVKAKRGIKNLEAHFYGYDNDPRVLATAQSNARRAGLGDVIQFAQQDAAEMRCPANEKAGVIVCNPPYGERLGTEPGLIALYTAFGVQMKTEFGGWTATIFSSSDELLSCIRMRAEKHYKLSNGALQCHLKSYSISDRPRPNAAEEQYVIAPDFTNRLKKNISKLNKWVKKEQVDAYRIYDADLPDYNAAIDVYKDFIVIQEYAAPKTISIDKSKRRLTDLITATIQVTGVDAAHTVLKVREKQKGKSQYEKLASQSSTIEIQEYGVKLIVNLYDYLDTGLFLDHRPIRRKLGQMANNKDFLNLFAYTGSATVHAACGGAKSTTTVDMSKTYIEWAKQNMSLNGQSGKQHRFEQTDCLQWLEHTNDDYDLIFIDPPTFSNSKRMTQTFDVQRDHIQLFENLKRLLRKDGTIVFSNNKRHFKMDFEKLSEMGLKATNISNQTIPMDFERNKHIHNCWVIEHNAQ
ncbi:bifunctional 23S rRNA (guanine(2069)-N(7))-methyltransferase RlmK/23S rRNA (guanine(2445)-N(2))-methyltransferase RlmL [Vibrio sp. RC27]